MFYFLKNNSKRSNDILDSLVVIFILFYVCSIESLCTYRADLDYPLCSLPYSTDNCPDSYIMQYIIPETSPPGYTEGFVFDSSIGFNEFKVITQEDLFYIYANVTVGEYYGIFLESTSYISDTDYIKVNIGVAPNFDFEFPSGGYMKCQIGEGYPCDPNGKLGYMLENYDMNWPAYDNFDISLNGHYINDLGSSICRCIVYYPNFQYHGVDKLNLTIALDSTTPFSTGHTLVCYEEVFSKRSTRSFDAVTVVQGTKDDSLYCDKGTVFGDDSVIVQKNNDYNATYTVSWNGEQIHTSFVHSSYWSWSIPDRVKIYGGILTVMVVYNDMTYSQCSIDIKGEDKCFLLSDGELPWSCMSDEARVLFVFEIMIFCLLAIILAVLCLMILMFCFGKCMQLPFFMKLCGGAMLCKPASASNGFDVAELTLSSFGLLFLIILVVLSIITLLYKMRSHIKVFAKFVFYNAKVYTKGSLVKRNSHVYDFAIIISLISVAYACDNTFSLHSLGNKCINGECHIDKSFQVELRYPGDCYLVTSNSRDYPISLTITYLNSGYKFLTSDKGYSQGFECRGESNKYCSSSVHIDDCGETNGSSGPTCSGIFPFTGYPANTGNPYTYCQCVYENSDPDCDGFPYAESEGYSVSYSYPFPTTNPQKLMESYSVIPYSIVSLTFMNGSSDYCIVTSGKSTCNWADVQIVLSQSGSAPEVTSVPIFLSDGSNHYFTPNSDYNGCGPLQIILDPNATLSDGGQHVYEKLCQFYYGSDHQLVADYCKQTTDYMHILPYDSTEFGVINAVPIRNVTHYLSILQGGFGPLEMDFTIEGTMRFNSTVQKVCPSIVDNNIEATGTCSSDVGGAFVITASSSCFPGVAELNCEGIVIKNPLLNLTTISSDFTIHFTTNKCSGKTKCKLSASTSTSFEIDLSQLAYQYYYYGDNALDYQQIYDSSNGMGPVKSWSFIGFLMSAVALFLLIVCLIAICLGSLGLLIKCI